MANIALSALDEHFVMAWQQMGDQVQRAARRRHGKPNYRMTRYADLCGDQHKRTTSCSSFGEIASRRRLCLTSWPGESGRSGCR
jgi:hypothetical protein